MSVNFTSVKCPECGASLPIEEGRTQVFCSYCGTKVIVTNDNEYIYRHIDEAGVKQAETDRMIRLRQLELEEAQAQQNAKLRSTLMKIWIPVSGIIILIGLGLMFFGGDMGPIYGFDFLAFVRGPIVGGGAYLIFKHIPERENDKVKLQNGGIRFPKGLEPFTEKNFEVIQSALRNAGFTNISCINMHDLTFGILQKPGKVEKITVDGKDITAGGKVYMSNIPITITYHGK